jgi:hypothetical protein
MRSLQDSIVSGGLTSSGLNRKRSVSQPSLSAREWVRALWLVAADLDQIAAALNWVTALCFEAADLDQVAGALKTAGATHEAVSYAERRSAGTGRQSLRRLP